MSGEAKTDGSSDISSVTSEVKTEPVVVGSPAQVITSVDEIGGGVVASGDKVNPENVQTEQEGYPQVKPGEDVVPCPRKVPEYARDPSSSTESTAVVAAAEVTSGLEKDFPADKEFAALTVEMESFRAKLAEFGVAGQFMNLHDVLGEVMRLRQEVEEGKHTRQELLKCKEDLDYRTAENDQSQRDAEIYRERYEDTAIQLDAFQVSNRENFRAKEAALSEVSQLKVQLEENQAVLSETRAMVGQLMDLIDNKDDAERVYYGLFRTAGEAIFKAMAMAGTFLPPKETVIQDLMKITAAAGFKMPFANLEELCGDDFDSKNVRAPEEPKQGSSKQPKKTVSTRGSETEPTNYGKKTAGRRGQKSLAKRGTGTDLDVAETKACPIELEDNDFEEPPAKKRKLRVQKSCARKSENGVAKAAKTPPENDIELPQDEWVYISSCFRYDYLRLRIKHKKSPKLMCAVCLRLISVKTSLIRHIHRQHGKHSKLKKRDTCYHCDLKPSELDPITILLPDYTGKEKFECFQQWKSEQIAAGRTEISELVKLEADGV